MHTDSYFIKLKSQRRRNYWLKRFKTLVQLLLTFLPESFPNCWPLGPCDWNPLLGLWLPTAHDDANRGDDDANHGHNRVLSAANNWVLFFKSQFGSLCLLIGLFDLFTFWSASPGVIHLLSEQWWVGVGAPGLLGLSFWCGASPYERVGVGSIEASVLPAHCTRGRILPHQVGTSSFQPFFPGILKAWEAPVTYAFQSESVAALGWGGERSPVFLAGPSQIRAPVIELPRVGVTVGSDSLDPHCSYWALVGFLKYFSNC